MTEKNEHFSSRWGILLAAIGFAVGTGNIWRFPRVAASNGGGAFLIAWLVFMFAWSVPLVLTEFGLGKHTRRGPAAAIGSLIGRKYNWMGVFVGLCTCFILFYYTVVTGWCLKYFLRDARLGSGRWGPGGLLAELHHRQLPTGPLSPACDNGGLPSSFSGVWSTGSSGRTAYWFPLVRPAHGSGTRGVMLPGAVKGLHFLFVPVWSDLLEYRVWLEALSQSAWSVGAAWGLIMTYAPYLRKRDDFVLTSYTTAFGDYSASLMAGIAVMCAVFAVLPEHRPAKR